MSVRKLPDDVLCHIYSYMPQSISSYKQQCVVNGDSVQKYILIHLIAINRIKLFLKIRLEFKKMNSKIFKQMKLMLRPFPNIKIKKGDCVYFAPVTGGKNAKCRFCMCTQSKHKYSNMFIETYYLILPSQQI